MVTLVILCTDCSVEADIKGRADSEGATSAGLPNAYLPRRVPEDAQPQIYERCLRFDLSPSLAPSAPEVLLDSVSGAEQITGRRSELPCCTGTQGESTECPSSGGERRGTQGLIRTPCSAPAVMCRWPHPHQSRLQHH